MVSPFLKLRLVYLSFGNSFKTGQFQVVYSVAQEEIAREVQAILQCSKLNPREQQIVLLHLSGLSLEEIGASLSRPITRERTRQIEAVAYRKLGQIPELFALWQKAAS